MNVKAVVLSCIAGLLALTAIICLLYFSLKKDSSVKGKDISANNTGTSLKVAAQPGTTAMKDLTRANLAGPLDQKTSESNLSLPPSDKRNTSSIPKQRPSEEVSLNDTEKDESVSTTNSSHSVTPISVTDSSALQHDNTLSVSNQPPFSPTVPTTTVEPASGTANSKSIEKASLPLDQKQQDDLLRKAIVEHCQNLEDSKARIAVEDAKKGSSIENAKKNIADQFYITTFRMFSSECARAALDAIKEGKSHEEAYFHFGKLLKASIGFKTLGYFISEPRYPDFLFKVPLTLLNYFFDGSMLPDTESANATINQNINRVFAYLENHPPSDIDLFNEKMQEIRGFIKNALGELIYIIQIKALSRRKSSETVDVVVDRAHKELQKIIQVYGFSPSEIQSIGSGFSATMTSAEVLNLLREKLFSPKLTWGTSLVSAGVPRPIINVNAICYAIATLQCFANFLPLWKMSAMKGITRDPTNANRVATRLDQVFELLNQSAGAPLDVTSHISLEGWGDSRRFIFELYNKIKQDNLIPERNLNDLFGVFSSSPLATLPMYPHCKIGVHWRRPCTCDQAPLIARGGLVVYDCNSSASAGTYDVPLSSKFMDLETGRYHRYDLHAFTFGGQIDDSDRAGHTFAYVKRKNGKWFCCNDSRVEEVVEDQVPITKTLQERYGKRPLVLFYLRME